MLLPEEVSITVLYKETRSGLDIYCDIWLPHVDAAGALPAVVYFHGGGLTVGNRYSWFPGWIHKRLTKLGYIFISADYQLLPPATGHDIVEDIKDLWAFLTGPNLLPFLSNGKQSFQINPHAIGLAGSSAGGLCAYLTAIHCISPKPKAILSIYGMLGDALTSHFLTPKKEAFYIGRDLLDPGEFSEFLYPFPKGIPSPTSDSPLAYYPATYHIPGYPANPCQLLARLYLQLGVFLDYYTGEYEPSLSSILMRTCQLQEGGSGSKLRIANEEARRDAVSKIPERHLALFPQFNISSAWPPTVLLHGTSDTAVPFSDSCHLRDLLSAEGVPVKLIEIEGQEHTFDYAPDAENQWGVKFNEAIELFHSWMSG